MLEAQITTKALMTQPVTAEAVREMRAQLRALISHAQQHAQRNGKPLTILLGEIHGDQRSWLNNILAVDEARKLGITSLGLEARSEDNIHWRKAIPGSLAEHASMMSLPALFPSLKPIPIESGINNFQNPDSMESRDANMARNIAAQNTSTISVVGSSHLLGIHSNPALQNHHILMLNVQDDPLKQGIFRNDKASVFSATSPHVHRLDIAGDARENSARELVGLAFPNDTKAKIQALDNAGYATSEEALSKAAARYLVKYINLSESSPKLAAGIRRDLSAMLQEQSHVNPALRQPALEMLREAYALCPKTDFGCRAKIAVDSSQEPENFRAALPFVSQDADNREKTTWQRIKEFTGLSTPQPIPNDRTTISGIEHLENEIKAARDLYKKGSEPDAAAIPHAGTASPAPTQQR